MLSRSIKMSRSRRPSLRRLNRASIRTRQPKMPLSFSKKSMRSSLLQICQVSRFSQGMILGMRIDLLSNGLNIAKPELEMLTLYLQFIKTMSTAGNQLKSLTMTTTRRSTSLESSLQVKKSSSLDSHYSSSMKTQTSSNFVSTNANKDKR